MSEVLADTGVKVANPTKSAEIRLRGLDDSVQPQEVVAAVAAFTGCPEAEVRVGRIRLTSISMGTLWVRCPLTAARKMVSAGRITVGWCSVRVEPLAPRQLQCYRCLEFGHTRSRCTSAVDRTGRCYRCGETTHTAGACTAVPKCPVCADLGRPADHRLGAQGCARTSGRNTRKKTAAPPSGKEKTTAPAIGPAGSRKLPAAGKGDSAAAAVREPTDGQVDVGLEETMVIDHIPS
ncbi:Uncharacterized 50 kDa protein in type I retrotransposable element R1DM [Anthophora retusa]